MKKKIIFTLIVIALSGNSYAQFSLSMGIGASTKEKGIAELSAQYDFNLFFVQTGYLAHLTRQVDAGTYINTKIGKHIEANDWFIEPSLGYAYVLRSTDYKELNANNIIYSATLGRNINAGSVYGSLVYCDKVGIALVGIRYNF